MIETVLAVLVISFVFLVLFKLSYMLQGKILLEHAAMRVARARAVGFNDFMCLKIARVAVLPISGRRLWPEGDEFDESMELGRVPVYLQTRDSDIARGVLDFEGWERLDVRTSGGSQARVSSGFELFDGAYGFNLDGRAQVERNAALYLNGGGL